MKVPMYLYNDQYDCEDDFFNFDFDVIDYDPDFTEYLWMADEEEFDKIELQRLEEEELIKDCIEAMLDYEIEEKLTQLENASAEEICSVLSALSVAGSDIEISTLNPMAAEFIPSSFTLPEPETAA